MFTICVGKSTSVLLTLLIPALGSPLSNRCCRCAGIVLQNGCQVASRVTDVFGESIIHGKIRKYQGNEQDVCVLWWTLSGLTSIKKLFSVISIWRIFPVVSTPSPLPRYSLRRGGGSLERPGTLCTEQGLILQKSTVFKTTVHTLYPILYRLIMVTKFGRWLNNRRETA